MKVAIRPLFGKIKNFTTEYTKAFVSIFSGMIFLIISAICQFHSLWQLDILCVGPVWGLCTTNVKMYSDFINAGLQRYSDLSGFQDGPFFHSTVGQAYDFFLGLNTLGWALAIVGTFLIMLGVVLFYRANYLEMRDYANDLS